MKNDVDAPITHEQQFSAEIDRLREKFDDLELRLKHSYQAYDAVVSNRDELRAEVERLRAQLSDCEIALADAQIERDMGQYEVKCLRSERDAALVVLAALTPVVPASPQANDGNAIRLSGPLSAEIDEWRDDRLAVAERAALLMRMEATRIAGRVIEQAGLKIGSAIVDDIRNLNAAAVARRAVGARGSGQKEGRS